ncbi:hypothetical protein AHF37_00177 [Paragonimus kellicotti]|nr:hypothetical protein AHF37_00177 [Paragonimus kellicotti]
MTGYSECARVSRRICGVQLICAHSTLMYCCLLIALRQYLWTAVSCSTKALPKALSNQTRLLDDQMGSNNRFLFLSSINLGGFPIVVCIRCCMQKQSKKYIPTCNRRG